MLSYGRQQNEDRAVAEEADAVAGVEEMTGAVVAAGTGVGVLETIGDAIEMTTMTVSGTEVTI